MAMLACRHLSRFGRIHVRCLSTKEDDRRKLDGTLVERQPEKPYPRPDGDVIPGTTTTTLQKKQRTNRMKEFRADIKYDRTKPQRNIIHKKTLDPRQFILEDKNSLKKAKLPKEITREGEERYVERLILSLKGSSYATLRSYLIYAKFAAECLDINTSLKQGKLTTGVYTVNRSPFVHGHHKDRFKRDIWNRQLILHDLSGTTADVYLSYVQRNIPAGVTMAVTEERLLPLDNEFLASYYDTINSKI